MKVYKPVIPVTFLNIEISLEDRSRTFIGITYESYLLFSTMEEKLINDTGFGIYPDKSDASGITLVKDVLMRNELVMEPHTGGVL